MPQPLPAPLPFHAVQPLRSGPLPASGPPGPPWPVDVTEVTGLWLPVQVSGGLYHPPRLLHGPASMGAGRAGPQGMSHTGARLCPGCPRPAGDGGAHMGAAVTRGRHVAMSSRVSLSFGWLTAQQEPAGPPCAGSAITAARGPGRAGGSPWVKCDQWCWGPGGAAAALGLQGGKGMRGGSGRVCRERKENRAGVAGGDPASATHRPCDLGSPDLSPALLI